MTVVKCRFYYSGIISLTDEMIATEEVVYYLSVVPRRRGYTKARHPGPQGEAPGLGRRQREQGHVQARAFMVAAEGRNG